MNPTMLKPAQTINIFQKHAELITFSAGETIFEQGQKGSCMYGVMEGEVDMIVGGKIIETIEPGDVFGEGALVQPDGSRASTAIAKTDCRLASIDEKHFLFAIQETPLFALQIIRSYSSRLRRLKTRL